MNNALKRKIYQHTMLSLAYAATAVTVAIVGFIIVYVFVKAVPNVTWQILSTKPSYINDTIGVLPDILNTIYIVIATLVFVLPLGVGAAIYLSEYARNMRAKRIDIYGICIRLLADFPFSRGFNFNHHDFANHY